jgi:CRISPR/Cas system-associated endonuclease/helicase Cas3
MVSMQETFGHDLHPWQANIVATLFQKKHGEPYLLVRPTGGGKSMIRDTLGLGLGLDRLSRHLF